MLKVIFCGLVLVLGVGALSYNLIGQKTDSVASKIEVQINKRNESLSKENQWNLKQNVLVPLEHIETGEKQKVLNLKWKSEKNFVHVEIVENESYEKAIEVYSKSTSFINGGIIAEFKGFGDKGIIVTDLPRDTITGINFVKGNYYISVSGGTKEVALDFAKLVNDSVH